MLTPRVPVAREGYPFISFAAFCTLTAALLGLPATTLILLTTTTFILCFFRDPERFTPTLEDTLIAPADGKVLFVKQVDDDKFTGGRACKVSIFMNVFNVHVNRIPISGTVEKIIYVPGKFYSADSEKGALHNEYCATVLTTASGSRLACVQVAGLIARRIVCWLEIGDSVTGGRRFGLIRFGSRVDLYLPPETEISVQPGQKVRAGETVLGHLS